MISSYLTKTATLKIPGGVNRNGEPENEVEQEIRVRWEGRRSLVRDAQGNQVVSEAKLYTDSPVPVGSVIVAVDGSQWTAISVAEHEWLGIRFYEVAL